MLVATAIRQATIGKCLLHYHRPTGCFCLFQRSGCGRFKEIPRGLYNLERIHAVDPDLQSLSDDAWLVRPGNRQSNHESAHTQPYQLS